MHVQPRHSNRKPLRTRIRYTDIGSCWSAARKLLHVSAYLDDAPLHRALSRGRFAGWSHSLYPIGAHPPLEPPSWRVSPSPSPSFSRLLLARRKYFHDKSRYTRVFMPRWRRPRRRWGFPRLRHRFFSAPHTRSLPPLSLLYHEVEWNWSNVPVFLLFCTLGFLLSVWWGLREFVWGVYVCVCMCIMRLLAVVRVLWRAGCPAVYAVYLFLW